MSAAFVIPVARDARGRLVSPDHAERGGVYACPSCAARVDLHAGDKKRRHFHHRAGASSCSSESALHAAAKELVVQRVEDWLGGRGAAPVFVRKCAHHGCEAITRQAMPKKVARASTEQRLRSGHVADVALLARAGDLVVGLVEILHTHAVDDTKAFELGVPWIEVDAAQVCAADGRELVAVRDRFLPWLCGEHRGTRGREHAQRRSDRERLARLARRLDYRLEDFPGYRVDRVTACANGHDGIVFAWDGRSPPDPRPPHLVARERELDATVQRARGWTKLLPYRRSFVSICPSCGEPLE